MCWRRHSRSLNVHLPSLRPPPCSTTASSSPQSLRLSLHAAPVRAGGRRRRNVCRWRPEGGPLPAASPHPHRRHVPRQEEGQRKAGLSARQTLETNGGEGASACKTAFPADPETPEVALCAAAFPAGAEQKSSWRLGSQRRQEWTLLQRRYI